LVETTVASDIAVHDDIEPEMSVMESISTGSRHRKMAPHMGRVHTLQAPPNQNTESYNGVEENDFHYATEDPLSTFSIDVDRASYSNIRRFINNGQLPPIDAVRVEEMINYFDYEYESPKGKDPVNIYTELGQAPWNSDHQLLQIGIKAKDLELESLPPSNIVFLIDVSGSMNQPNKLPLLKSSMKILVQQMRDKDRVAIVVYAGAAGLVLESTPGDDKQKIYNAIDNLSAGGSTAGGAGIKLAYQVALENFVEDGNNRIVLATDGDFNVGAASDSDMEALIKTKRDQGVFLTVLGFGMGNYKDSKMEILADKGNGNYAYIDNITEAKKTLVNEFGGTMFAVAKDVKIQVEFNPANVAEYRLI
jgi:Ca-activated chloride channel family protein